MDFYKQGQEAALMKLGLISPGAVSKAAPRLWPLLGQTIKSVGQGVGGVLFGHPIKFIKEVGERKAFSPEGLIRFGFRAKHPIEKGLLYGFPMYQVGSILGDPEGRKTQRIGGAIGGNIAGMAAFGPAGLAGAIGAGMLGERLGQGIGAIPGKLMGGSKAEYQSVPYDQMYPGLNYMGL